MGHITRLAKVVAVMMCAALTVAASLPVAAAPAGGYVIHPNDQLNVQVFGDASLSQTVTVLPSGDIDYPLVGSIHVAGQNTEQAAKTVANALRKYVRNPHVTVLVTQQGQMNVLVLGGVEHPGKVELPSNATFVDAVAAAGGLSGSAQTYQDATVTAYDGSATKVSLQKIYAEGDLSGNVAVSDGAKVFVPTPVAIDVEVSGAVDHPGQIELAQGDRLSMAIAKAGNSNQADADLNNIHVTRTLASGQVQSYNVNLYQELQQGNVSKDMVLEKGDVVFVPKAKHGLNGDTSSASSNPFYLLLIGARLLFPHI